MIYANCIQKLRNKNNIIEGYILQDSNGNTIQVTSQQLKQAIYNKQIEIVNLQLTKSGRLLDKSTEAKINSYNIMGKNDIVADERQTTKAKILGVAPKLNERNEVVGLADGNITSFTDATNILATTNLSNASQTVQFNGNKELICKNRICNFHVHKAIISNPAAMVLLSENSKIQIYADEIYINHSLIDIKTVDEIFKILKSSIKKLTMEQLKHITMCIDTLDKDTVYSRVAAILKRQKPSSNRDRRAYDIWIYFWFLYCMYISTGCDDNRYRMLASEYIREFNEKFNKSTFNSYESFVNIKYRQMKDDISNALRIQFA